MEFGRVVSLLILYFAFSESTFLPIHDIYPCRNGAVKIIDLSSVYSWSSSGIIELTSYTYNANCSVVLKSSYPSGITISIKEFNVAYSFNSKLTFSDGYTWKRMSGGTYFPSRQAIYTSNRLGTSVSVNFKSTDYGDNFKLVYTAFINGTRCKYSWLYQCDNGRCINDDFVCDGNNHCGDSSDLDYCDEPSIGAIIGYVFGSIFLIVACVCIVVCVVRRKRRMNVVTGTTLIHPPPGNYPPSNMVNPAVYASYPTGYQQPPYAKFPEAPPPYAAPPSGRDNPMYH